MSTKNTIELFVPKANPRAINKGLVARPETLDNKVVAVMDNGKPNAGPLMERVAKLLGQRFKIAEVVTFKRMSNTSQWWNYEPLTDRLNAYPKKIDVAITGMGD
ncbi:MAG: hypothetical protein HYX97_03750 [Chloroflexi bacterium]|nr:hypothetical protein [Chloroflexota bacterium]